MCVCVCVLSMIVIPLILNLFPFIFYLSFYGVQYFISRMPNVFAQMLILLYSDTNYVLDGFRAEYFISNW